MLHIMQHLCLDPNFTGRFFLKYVHYQCTCYNVPLSYVVFITSALIQIFNFIINLVQQTFIGS